MEKFSELIHMRREQLGLSLRDLEKRLKEEGVDLSKTFLIFLEREKKKPTYDTAFVLAKVLDIDVEKALKAAYRARADFDKERERDNLARFISNHGLTGLDAEKILR